MKPRSNESGFALLLIFVLAAGIAISLMMQMPRVCFETQRDREQVLIDRGEQYQRAIGLYVRKFNRYPARMEELESTNNIRFLRRRYIDPMTGKDEWRLIHAGPGGVLTDSLVQKAPGMGPDGKPLLQSGMPGSGGMNNANMSASNMTPGSGMNVNPGNTGTDPNDPNGANPAIPEVNQAVKARPSDRIIGRGPGGGVMMLDPSQVAQGQPNAYGNPQPPAPGYQQYPQPGQPGFQGQAGYPQANQNPQAGYQQPVQPGLPQMVQQGVLQPGQPGYQQQQPPNIDPLTGQPLQPGQPGYQPLVQPSNAQPGQPLQPGQPGFPQPVQPGFPQPVQQGFPQPNYPQPGPYTQPQQFQPQPFQQPPFQPQPFQPQPFPAQAGYPQPGQPQFQQQPFQPQQQQAGAFSPVTSAVGATPFNAQPGNSNSAGGGQNSAAQMIQQILTQPRQPPPGMGGSLGSGQALGAGIAGVATKFKSPSIKVYQDRKKYQEWEFVYDPRKEEAKRAGLAAKTQNPTNPGNKVSDSFGSTSSSFGSTTSSSTTSNSPSSNFNTSSPNSSSPNSPPSSTFNRTP